MTTERIRWERNDDGSSVTAAHEGYAGTISEPLFFIFEPDDRDPWWILTSSLPGLPGAGRAERRAHGADTDKLRAEAERWLAEFAGSLGAVFPDDEDEFSDEDDEWLEVTWAAGRRVRFAHPDAGYPGEAEEAMKALTPGRVYTIAWADIGQSRTDLNLAAKGKSLGRFNSVLFEPVDDEAAPMAAPTRED